MSEQKRNHVEKIEEGYIKKGGRNEIPDIPRPAPPKGQCVQQTNIKNNNGSIFIENTILEASVKNLKNKSKMNKDVIIAFDIDGTLIWQEGNPNHTPDTPNYTTIALFNALQAMGCTMVIWSGGGIDYATHWKNKLGLDAIIKAKGSIQPDIAFDDEKVMLGKTNIKIGD